MKVKEIADIAGVSVRTLHHYDEIGLLSPKETTEKGYRIYSNEDLEQLQQILFFKELNFPLKEIKHILSSPTFDKHEALLMHRNMLINKRDNLNEMLQTLDKTIKHMKGEITMTKEEHFKGFDFSQNPYEKEAKDRWGKKKVDETNTTIKTMSKEERSIFEDTFNDIYIRLAKIRHEAPDSEIAQEGIKEWYTFLNQMGKYSLEAFAGLGQMYVNDERFTENIDRFGEGLATFMCDAMAVYAERNR